MNQDQQIPQAFPEQASPGSYPQPPQGPYQQVPQPPQGPSQQAPEKKTGTGKLVAAIFIVVGAPAIAFIPSAITERLGMDSTLSFELWGTLFAAAFLIALGGRKLLKPSLGSFKETVKALWPLLVINAFVGIVSIISTIVENGATVSENWPIMLVYVAVTCLFIGLLEEILFRGVLQQGLLARLGTSRRGIIWSLVITSICFGLIHVLFSGDMSDPVQALQAVLKVLQTGLFGFVLSYFVIRTKNLTGAVLFHALNDFLLSFTTIFYEEELVGQYVMGGDEAWMVVIAYTIFILILLPFAVKTWRKLKQISVPYRGECWEKAAQDAPAQQ